MVRNEIYNLLKINKYMLRMFLINLIFVKYFFISNYKQMLNEHSNVMIISLMRRCKKSGT
jgi:hypothetical protein